MKSVLEWWRHGAAMLKRVLPATRRWEHARMEQFDQHDWKITIPLSNGHEEVYIGSCTVWMFYPSGVRPGTFMESSLCSTEKRLRWRDNLTLDYNFKRQKEPV